MPDSLVFSTLCERGVALFSSSDGGVAFFFSASKRFGLCQS